MSILALVSLPAGPGVGFAEELDGIASKSCGSSTREAIAAGKKALHSQSREDEHAALVCLIEALSSVDARLHALEAGDRKPQALIAPKGAWRNQR